MQTLKLVTYNIHKGVQGIGPLRRLEIHNLNHALAQMDADVLCLQEVRKHHQREARHFSHWPKQPQADFLAPTGYQVVYQSNAYTRYGEHGNALLTRWPVLMQHHVDISDHRLEQRGFLHAELQIAQHRVHVLVVHLGLIRASRTRQLLRLRRYIEESIPSKDALWLAGDFNDVGSWLERQLAPLGLRAPVCTRCATFPARWPLLQLDHVFARGFSALNAHVPRGGQWSRLSDHLPLFSEWQWEPQVEAS